MPTLLDRAKTLFSVKPAKNQGKPANAALLSEINMTQVVGLLARMPDPDEALKKAGINRAQLRSLEGDDEISGALDTRREAVLATPWRLEPYNSDAISFINDEIKARLDDILRGGFVAVPYGYSVLEVVYMRHENGRIGLAKVQEKPFEWFYWSTSGQMMRRGTDGTEYQCDPLKFFATVRSASYRNPYGEALLSRLYWPWFFRTHGWQFWMQWLERWGTPFLVGKTTGSPENMANALAAAVQSATIAVNVDEEVHVVQQNSGSAHFEHFEEAVTKRIQKMILGQTLTTDAKGGSFAAAKVHDNVRMDKRNADIRLIGGTVQRIINALWLLNDFAGEPPAFVMEDGTGLELERAKRDAELLNTGRVKLSREYFINNYDFEDGEVEVVEPEAVGKIHGLKATAGVGALNAGLMMAAGNRQTKFTDDQQAIEDLGASALLEAQPMISGAAIANVIESATSPENLEARLANLMAGVDAETFNEVLTRCLFAADVMGYVHQTNADIGVHDGK